MTMWLQFLQGDGGGPSIKPPSGVHLLAWASQKPPWQPAGWKHLLINESHVAGDKPLLKMVAARQ